MTQIPTPDIHLAAIAPEITLTVVAILLLMVEVFSVKKGGDHLGYLALSGVLFAGWLTFPMTGTAYTTFSGMYVVDNFSTFMKLVLLLATGLTILISIRYSEEERVDSGEYYALLLLTTVGMFFMASGSDMMTIFMGLEVMSISLYVLAGYTRGRPEANEASLKYFILGALSTGFLLYGMALVYGATGSTKLSEIGSAVSSMSGNTVMLIVGASMILLGFAFKVAAVPFHMWTPDVYQGAPTPITAFMSAGPKAAAFAAFLRIFAEAFGSLRGEWWEIIWILSVVTMTVGNVVALKQDNVKRMLAYSSIAHAGYLLVGFVTASERGSSGMLVYLLVYTFMNIGAFAVVSIVGSRRDERTSFSDYAGLGAKYPLLAATLAIMLFSLAGIPPTAGFIGKFYIFMAAMEEGFYVLAIIGVINSVVSVFYYLRLTVYMYFKDGEGEKVKLTFAPTAVVALAVSVYGVLWIGINPSDCIEFAKTAFLSF